MTTDDNNIDKPAAMSSLQILKQTLWIIAIVGSLGTLAWWVHPAAGALVTLAGGFIGGWIQRRHSKPILNAYLAAQEAEHVLYKDNDKFWWKPRR